ncbi:MAG: hypothetical protein ACUVWP_00040 [bacterium]
MVLYHKSDIGQSGIISRLEFLSTRDGQSVTYDYIRLNLCNTSKETLDTIFENNYDGKSPTTVFSSTSVELTGNKDVWVPFEFYQDFNFDSSKNLLLEVGWSGCSDADLFNYVFPKKGIHTIYTYNDFNAYSATYTTETANMIRLTIQFTGINNSSLGMLKALYK